MLVCQAITAVLHTHSNLGLEYARSFVKNMQAEVEDSALNKRVSLEMSSDAHDPAERLHWLGFSKEAAEIESSLRKLLFKYERELQFGELCHLDQLDEAKKVGRLNEWAVEFTTGSAMPSD